MRGTVTQYFVLQPEPRLRTSRQEKLASKPPPRLTPLLALVRDQPPTSLREQLREPPSLHNRQQPATTKAFSLYPCTRSSHQVMLCYVGGGHLLGISLEVVVMAFSQGQ